MRLEERKFPDNVICKGFYAEFAMTEPLGLIPLRPILRCFGGSVVEESASRKTLRRGLNTGIEVGIYPFSASDARH